MKKEDWSRTDTSVLAYVGDSVYEIFVRKHVIEAGNIKLEQLHKAAVSYVKAEAQASALRQIMPDLSEPEADLVRRARNKRISSKPKHASPLDYKLATAFEALVGYLYLSKEMDRLQFIIKKVIDWIDEAEKESLK